MASIPEEAAYMAWSRLAPPYNGVVAIGEAADGRPLRAEVWDHGVPHADRYPFFVAVT